MLKLIRDRIAHLTGVVATATGAHGLRAGALAAAVLLAGCAGIKGTGMQMDVVAPGNSNPSGSLSEDVRARADVFTLNVETVTRLERERRAQDDLARAQRRKMAADAAGYDTYRVGHQDVLRVTVWNHPELTNPAGTANELAGRVVNGDGSFYYPFAGRVKAVGRTLEEIRIDLTQALAKVLRDPQVEVAVLQYRSKKAYIAGEVKTPGAQPITDIPLRVTDLVAASGGPTSDADLSNVTLQRGRETFKLDLNALYYQGDLTQNLRILDGDVLTIAERRNNKVFVMGEVGAQRSLQMPQRARLSLAEALAEAGGVNQLSSNASQIYVVRAGDSGRPQIYHLNASTPDAMVLADRFDLQTRDVVFVDAAAVVRWNRVLSAVLPTIGVSRELLNDLFKGLPR
jgi:polysaccharide export outer membrane protein